MNVAADTATSPAIELSNLRFGYGSQADVIAIPELRVAASEKAFLHGPSGSGKSTLLALIGGVLLPREGRVSVLGRELSATKGSLRDQFRADHIGFVFQQFNLVSYLTVDENVCLPCRYSARRLERARSSDGGAAQAAVRLLDALGIGKGLRARKPTDLSVGQQQRIAVARALIGRPELIVADEPTSALDTDRRREFIDLLLSECNRSDSAVVFVSHDASLATHFDRAIDLQSANTATSEADAA